MQNAILNKSKHFHCTLIVIGCQFVKNFYFISLKFGQFVNEANRSNVPEAVNFLF